MDDDDDLIENTATCKRQRITMDTFVEGTSDRHLENEVEGEEGGNMESGEEDFEDEEDDSEDSRLQEAEMTDDDLTENTATCRRHRITMDTFVEETSDWHLENEVEGEEGGNMESGEEDFEDEEDDSEDSRLQEAETADDDLPENTATCKRQRTTMDGEDMEDDSEDSDEHVCSKLVKGMLTDLDSLDCPICFKFLTSPVFQCENGHIACDSCCLKISEKCPSCSLPIGSIRCRDIEKIVESVEFSCPNEKYGCAMSCRRREICSHVRLCNYAPCSCPLENCGYVGSVWGLKIHFEEKHLTSAKCFRFDTSFSINLEKEQKCVILRAQNDGTIFVLNHHLKSEGSAVNVIQIFPSSSKSSLLKYSYKIIAKAGGSSYTIESFAEFFPKWSADLPLKGYLFIPITRYSTISLEVCVKGRVY